MEDGIESNSNYVDSNEGFFGGSRGGFIFICIIDIIYNSNAILLTSSWSALKTMPGS